MNFWNYLTENENFPASTQYLISKLPFIKMTFVAPGLDIDQSR